MEVLFINIFDVGPLLPLPRLLPALSRFGLGVRVSPWDLGVRGPMLIYRALVTPPHSLTINLGSFGPIELGMQCGSS